MKKRRSNAYTIKYFYFKLGMILIVFTLFNNNSIAQDCSGKLEQAQNMYEKGQFGELISLIENCTTSPDKNEQWKTFRLLALAHLANNEHEKARDDARNLLKLNPTYKSNKLNDPSELTKLLKSIPIIPKISLGLAFSIGTNTTFPRINDVYSLAQQVKKYEGKNSFQFGISSQYQINKIFAIDATLMVSSKKYQMDYSFGNWDLNMDESLTYLNIPIEFRYYPKINFPIKPFVQVGGYLGYLIFAENDFYANYRPGSESYSLENISSLERRNRLDAGVVGAIGANYKIGAGQLFLHASYFHSMRKAVNGNERYSNNQLVYSYYYIDDDFTLSNVAVGIGYSLFINYKVLND
jgi:hypothetical protein